MKIAALRCKIRDLELKDAVLNRSLDAKIQKSIKKCSKIEESQNKALRNSTSSPLPKEIIVVFSSIKSKKKCLNDYSKYSHWYSSTKSMPDDLKLNNSYSFKISEAPEPFEIQQE